MYHRTEFWINFVRTYSKSSAFARQWHQLGAIFYFCIWKRDSANSLRTKITIISGNKENYIRIFDVMQCVKVAVTYNAQRTGPYLYLAPLDSELRSLQSSLPSVNNCLCKTLAESHAYWASPNYNEKVNRIKRSDWDKRKKMNYWDTVRNLLSYPDQRHRPAGMEKLTYWVFWFSVFQDASLADFLLTTASP